MDLDSGVVDDGVMANISFVGVQETVKLIGNEFFELVIVESLSKITPHGTEHHFGEGL